MSDQGDAAMTCVPWIPNWRFRCWLYGLICGFTFDHINDRARWRMVPRTAVNGGCEQPFNVGKIDHFGADLFEMMSGNFPHFIATCVGRSAKGENAANLFRTEAKLSRSSNEADCAKVAFIINPVSAFSASRCRDHADAFEIADGFDVHASLPR